MSTPSQKPFLWNWFTFKVIVFIVLIAAVSWLNSAVLPVTVGQDAALAQLQDSANGAVVHATYLQIVQKWDLAILLVIGLLIFLRDFQFGFSYIKSQTQEDLVS